jgi:hypothetical protein
MQCSKSDQVCTNFAPSPRLSQTQAIAQSKAVNRASPTTRAAPDFENDTPTEALEGFDEVDAGPVVVLEGFPVVVAVPEDFVTVVPELVDSLKNAVKKFPIGTTSVVIADPALLIVRVWPSPTQVVAMLPTGMLVEVLPAPVSSSWTQLV